MKLLKVMGVALATLLFAASPLSAASSTKKGWNEYNSGPALRIWGDNGIALDYYFLKDNQLSIGFNTIPYQFIKNEDGINNQTGHQTSIGVNAYYYFRLWPEHLKNKFFFSLGMGWAEIFGHKPAPSRSREIQYAWSIFPQTGLEYRMNDHFYFGLVTLPFSYLSTKLQRDTKRTTVVNVFFDASAYVTLKF